MLIIIGLLSFPGLGQLGDVPPDFGRDLYSGKTAFCGFSCAAGCNKVVIGERRSVLLIDAVSGKVLDIFPVQEGGIYCVALSPDGKKLACSSERHVVVWEIAKNEQLVHFVGDDWLVYGMQFAPDNRTLAVLRHSKRIDLIDTSKKKNEVSGSLEVKNDMPEINRILGFRMNNYISFSRDGKYLATPGKENTVLVWNVARRDIHAVLKGHQDQVWSVTFSPTEDLLVSGQYYQTRKPPDGGARRRPVTGIILWDVEKKEALAILPNRGSAPGSLAISPDGKTLAAGCIKIFSIFDLPTRALRYTIDGDAKGIGFSADSKSVYAIDYGIKLRAWDIPETGPLKQQGKPSKP